MMNAEFREWDFLIMEYFLQSKEDFYSFFIIATMKEMSFLGIMAIFIIVLIS